MKSSKKVLPYIIAFLIFVIIPAIYFAPQFEGLDIRKFDSVQAEGMTSALMEHVNKYGENPHWIANMFGGMPSYPINFDAPPDLIKKTSTVLYFLGEPAAFYFIMMAGFFVMLICFGVNPWLAIVGSVAYGLSTYFIIIFEAGHIMKIVALAYVAPLIGALYYTYRKSILIGAPLFGVFTLMEIASVHPQITYYFIIAMVIMTLSIGVWSYRERQLRKFFAASAALVLTTLLAVGANIMYLYYTYDYSKDSIRGASILLTEGNGAAEGLDKDYITAWSYGKMETFNLFIPNLMGGKSSGGFSSDGAVSQTLQKYTNANEAARITKQLPAYWGPQPMTSGPVYIGAVMIFLFVLGLFIVRGVNLWWIVGATALSIILAWGKHMMGLTDLFIDYFPLYNKFRTVSMILVVAELTIPLMAMLALSQVWDGRMEMGKLKSALIKSLYITGGVAIFFLLFGASLFNFVSSADGGMGLPEDVVSAMREERISMLRLDAMRSLAFVVLTFGVVWFMVKHKISKVIFVAVLFVLVVADMVPVAVRHVNYSMFNESKSKSHITAMSDVDREILKDTDINYRVANFAVSTFNDATTSVHHRSIGGYFAAKPRRYQDLIDQHLSKMNMGVYNMLNTKYFIVASENGGPQIKVNGEAYGNAWVVGGVKKVMSPNEEIAALSSTDLRNVAVVADEFSSMVGEANFELTDDQRIEQTQYRANRMEYKSNFSAPRLVVFSEIYYPKGWKAYIDGVEVPYFRANYVLNALVVPAGEHTVLFEFTPPHYTLLRTTTMVASSLLVLLLIVGIIVNVIKRKNRDVA